MRDAAPFGSSLHLLVDDPAADVPRIEQFLAARGLAWRRIEPIKPTLEDVFVQLVGARRPGEATP